MSRYEIRRLPELGAMKRPFPWKISIAALLAVWALTMNAYHEAKSEAAAWRKLYLMADADAKYVNCIPLDDNYTLCEKP